MPNADVVKESAVRDAFGPAEALLVWGSNYCPTDNRYELVINYGFLKAAAIGLRDLGAAFEKYHGVDSGWQSVRDLHVCKILAERAELHARLCLTILGALSKDVERQDELARVLWENFKQFFFDVPDIDVFWAIVSVEAPFHFDQPSKATHSINAITARASQIVEIQDAIAATGSTSIYVDDRELHHLVRGAAWAMGGFMDCLSTGTFAKPPGHNWEIN